jgi:hypothetical protein
MVAGRRARGGRGAACRRPGRAVLPDAGAAGGAGGRGGDGAVPDGGRDPGLGGRAVGGGVHRGRDVRVAGAAAVRAEGAAPRPREGRPPRAGAVGKGGLATALAAVGLTAGSRTGFADELRLGLRGTTRRVWGRRGIKVRQRLQPRYEWCHLVAAVDARTGTLWWDWVDTMKAVDLLPVVAELRARPRRRRRPRGRAAAGRAAAVQPGAEPGRAPLPGCPPPRRGDRLRHPRRQGRRGPGVPPGARRRPGPRPPPLRLGLDHRRPRRAANTRGKGGVITRDWY